MRFVRIMLFVTSVWLLGCTARQDPVRSPEQVGKTEKGIAHTGRKEHGGHVAGYSPNPRSGKGGLLLTRFKSFEELQSVIDIQYFDGRKNALNVNKRPQVVLTHAGASKEVTSILHTGVSELDFLQAHDEGLIKRLLLVIKSPYGVWNLMDLRRIYALARRRSEAFGEGDVAFYDIAETMMFNINDEDIALMPPENLSEKGYLNTFNHIAAQAMMTSIFSEKLADFVADIHERRYMPELITGDFSEEQILDLETGPVDNYVDIINNEWGQEIGKDLRRKYQIHRNTHWTPELLAAYLNDIQSYCSWSFQVGFKPFRPTDDLMIRFAKKINTVISDVPLVR